MKSKIILPAVLAAFVLTGCGGGSSLMDNSNQAIGALGGALAGGVVGSQFGSGSGRLWATGIGTALGALGGGMIGSQLDEADQTVAGQAAQQTFESAPIGQATTWQNPDSGNYGTIMPTRTTQQGAMVCREFTQTIYVDGQSQSSVGTACRNPDGTWGIAR